MVRPLAARVEERQTGRLIACFGPWLKSGGSLYCLDGGNVFDPYALTAWLRSEGLAPETALERIFISRAYTCHQLVGAVETLLGVLADKNPASPALILGIERMFLDENLPLFERRHLFGRILREAGELRRRGLPLLITFLGEAQGEWPRSLARSARVVTDAQAVARRLGWEERKENISRRDAESAGESQANRLERKKTG